MGRPLLTDEMIERANRGEDISGPPLHDEEETKILKTTRSQFGYSSPTSGFNQDTLQIDVEPTVTKSRRIENAKRGVFQAKLNKILFWIVLLLIALIAGNRPWGVLAAALAFAAMQVGANSMQRQLGVPSALVSILIGFVVLLILGRKAFHLSLLKRKNKEV